MDDHPELQAMYLTGAFYTVIIGAMIWQVLRLLSRGGLDGQGVIRLGASIFILGILCYVGYTALSLWA